ncbi:protein phosphatase 2C domain-containing protein [Streptomyces sp. TR06-5]|uniref:protein phosphatase 2C domain-containing protein n=1 Tax=unclassified Streptomyces TaxID=2593676 RepID=UPI0039A1E1BA
MPQNERPSACPGCDEPAEAGDRFCGACGTALPAVPQATPAPPSPAPLAAGSAGDGSGAGTVGDDPVTTSLRPGAGAPGAGGDGDAHAEPAHGAHRPGDAPAPAETRDDSPDTEHCVACGTGAVGPDGHCTDCGHQQPVARDHWERERDGAGGVSDLGLRRRRNEDFFTLAAARTPAGEAARIAVVCDGVSSAQRSDRASEAAAEAAAASLCASLPRDVHPQQALHDALVAAGDAVDVLATDEERAAQRNAPACTIVGAVVTPGVLTVGWVGDSRAYWVPDDRDARPARLTTDDSWAAHMVASGLMTEAQAQADPRAHAITGWLGADAYELDPHTASFQPDRSGVVVVCSDGLWNYAETARQMAEAVPPDAAERPLAAARHLVGLALDGGGHDNVTVAVVPFTTPQRSADHP